MAAKESIRKEDLLDVPLICSRQVMTQRRTENEFAEAVFVMLFFKVGEAFEGYAERRSRRAISHLMEIRPDNANVVRGEAVTVVPAETVAVGETIVVKPGERIPLDGVVTSGQSSLDTVALPSRSPARACRAASLWATAWHRAA